MKRLDGGDENVTGGYVCARCGAASTDRYERSSAHEVLVLGLLSVLVCALLGPVVWQMGSAELARIDAGEVDPVQRGYAHAGRILGVVATSMLGVGILLGLCFGLLHLLKARPVIML